MMSRVIYFTRTFNGLVVKELIFTIFICQRSILLFMKKNSSCYLVLYIPLLQQIISLLYVNLDDLRETYLLFSYLCDRDDDP